MVKTQNKTKKAVSTQGKQKAKRATLPTKVPRRRRVVNAPAAIAEAQRYLGKGGRSVRWRFSNSEFIGNVNGSVGFTVSKYSVNPGLVGTFPWLSVEAARWEQYKFHKLCFRYVTRTGTSTIGSVIMSPEYNVRDPPPTTEAQANNTQNAVEDAPWKNFKCELSVADMFMTNPRKIIRSGMVSGELNSYDAASFFLCTAGMVGTDMVGKLWVDYDVEMTVPQSSPPDMVPTSHAFWTRASAQVLPGGAVVTWNPDSTTAINPLSITEVDGVYSIPAGAYLLQWKGSLSAAVPHNVRASLAFTAGGLALANQPVTLIDFVGDDTERQHCPCTVSAFIASTGDGLFPVRLAITNLNADEDLTVDANTTQLLITPA